MDKAHDIRNVRLSGDTLSVTVDGTKHEVDLSKQSKRLAAASPKARSNFIISASGYGIHWPDIDEDLSIDGLIGIKHTFPLVAATV